MPAKDRFHPSVVRALTKDGWQISEEQYKLIIGERRLWIDLQVSKPEQNLTILIEIKDLENSASAVAALGDTVGQYLLYQVALLANDLAFPLYLAVPESAYQGILSEELGQRVIRHFDLKLLAFDPYREVITRWMP